MGLVVCDTHVVSSLEGFQGSGKPGLAVHGPVKKKWPARLDEPRACLPPVSGALPAFPPLPLSVGLAGQPCGQHLGLCRDGSHQVPEDTACTSTPEGLVTIRGHEGEWSLCQPSRSGRVGTHAQLPEQEAWPGAPVWSRISREGSSSPHHQGGGENSLEHGLADTQARWHHGPLSASALPQGLRTLCAALQAGLKSLTSWHLQAAFPKSLCDGEGQCSRSQGRCCGVGCALPLG